jgi:hypothetical protein
VDRSTQEKGAVMFLRRRHHPFVLILAVFALLLVLGLVGEILAHMWLILAVIALVGTVHYLSTKPHAGARIPARPTAAPKIITSEVIHDDKPEPETAPETQPESERDRLVNDGRSGARPLF